METSALARGCPAPGSDRERPALYTLNRLGKALQTPGATYEVLPWETFISKEEEDRLTREGRSQGQVELRARAMEYLELAHYTTMRALSDRYYSKVNASVAAGMRTPTLNELRRFDREMQVVVYRHLSRGQGSMEDAMKYYIEHDSDSLWRLMDPVLKNMPDQGVEESMGHKQEAKVESGRASSSSQPTAGGNPMASL
eukprot:s1434_g29.t1